MGNPSLLSSLRIFIIDAKMDANKISKLQEIAKANGGAIVNSIEESNVILTTVHAKKRLERHINEESATSKAIVTPDWLTDSVERRKLLPFRTYAAIRSVVPPSTLIDLPLQRAMSPSHTLVNDPFEPKQHTLPENFHRLSVCRRAPLVCPNQDLVLELAVIKKARWLHGDDRSALSYSRSIAALKSYPRKIVSGTQVASLPGIGPKIIRMVDEFVESGEIEEARRMATSPRNKVLAQFTETYGIGPSTARNLYDVKGLRSIADLEHYAGLEVQNQTQSSVGQDLPHGEALREALLIREDMMKKIPRSEVERMAQIVSEHLEVIQPGCKYTICGGYRRGKPESNDVDIIFTHPQRGKEQGLCAKLVKRLQRAGIITHLLHLSSFTSTHETGPRPKHFAIEPRGTLDSLDKALTVVRIPPADADSWHGQDEATSSKRPRPAFRSTSSTSEGSSDDISRVGFIPEVVPHRRLDLIFTSIDAYYTAIVGWTGSTQFMRDIRIWANEAKGYNFDSSGITRIRDTTRIPVHSEREVFEVLGLEYIEPEWRNADV